jgi:hypothetical protein
MPFDMGEQPRAAQVIEIHHEPEVLQQGPGGLNH